MSESKWMTIKQAAAYLGIGEPTLYRWMKDKKITFRKVGDSTRFLQRDLDAFVRVVPAEGDTLAVKQRCTACQGEQLVKGRTQSTGLMYFKPEKVKFWTLKDSTVPTETYMCLDCGALSQYAQIEKMKQLLAEGDQGSNGQMAVDEV